MKKILQFFAIFSFFVFAQNVNALTLISNCDGKPCPYKVDYINLFDRDNENNLVKDNDTSSIGREKLLSIISGGKENINMFTKTSVLNVEWNISKIDKKYSDKGDIIYLLSYGCSKTPDINKQDGTIRNLPFNSLYWEIPKGDCTKINYCKIWISVRDTSVKDKDGNYKKIAGANTKPFLVCPGQLEIRPPTLFTQEAQKINIKDPKTKKETTRQFIFNGKLLDLGNDTAVTTTFVLAPQKSLLTINQSKITLGKTSKIYLKGEIDYSYPVAGLSIGNGWCYRIEGQNKYINAEGKPEWASGGTRCYPDDKTRIIKPIINERDVVINYKQYEEKIGSGQVNKYITLDGKFLVDEDTLGRSVNTKAFLYIGSIVNIADKYGKLSQQINYSLYKFNEQKEKGGIIKKGTYTFDRVRLGANDFSYKLVLLNEDGKSFVEQHFFIKPTTIKITEAGFGNDLFPTISGIISDEVERNRYKNATHYYAKFERLSDVDRTASGFCPKNFYSIKYPLANIEISDNNHAIDKENRFSFNLFNTKFRYNNKDSGEEKNLHACKFEPYTKYKVTLLLDLKQQGTFRESDPETISFSTQRPDVLGQVSPSRDILGGKSKLDIKTTITNNKGNVAAKLFYKAIPLGPGGSCDFFDNGNNQGEEYDGIVTSITKPFSFSGNDEHQLILPYPGRKYCVVLSMQLLDSNNNPIGEPFEYYRSDKLVSPAVPPIVEIQEVKDSDKTWGGAKITAKLISSGVKSDKNLDGKIDGEALISNFTFVWKYSFEQDFGEFKNQLPYNTRDVFEKETRTLEFSQKERDVKPKDFKDSEICVAVFARNVEGIDSIRSDYSRLKCFDPYYKPEIEVLSAYPLGGDKIAFKGKILKNGNAQNLKINVLASQHPLASEPCSFKEELPIPMSDNSKFIKDGDNFIYIMDNFTSLLAKSSGDNKIGNINQITAQRMRQASCYYQFRFSISIDGIENNNDNTGKADNKKHFKINTVGAGLPANLNQYEIFDKVGCSSTAFMYLVYDSYYNNSAVRKKYNDLAGLDKNTPLNVNNFNAPNDISYSRYKKVYQDWTACGIDSTSKTAIKLGLIRSDLGRDYIKCFYDNCVPSNINDKKAMTAREEMIRDMYEKALSNNIPVVVRTVRNDSQHYFVVRGIYFDTDNGLPDYETVNINGSNIKRIKLSDNDKIYMTDTFPRSNHYEVEKTTYIKWQDDFNGYMAKKDFLDYFRCFSTDKDGGGYSPGGLIFGYYLISL